MVMLIQIGHEVPSIGRALQSVSSIWDQMRSLGFSRKQSCVALCTAEAEYVVACSASCEAVWLRKLLFDLFNIQLDAICIYCDNQGCVKLAENSVFHDKSKHVEIKYHYIQDMVQRGEVNLLYVAMNEQIIDVLTKPLARVKFEYFKERLGVI